MMENVTESAVLTDAPNLFSSPRDSETSNCKINLDVSGCYNNKASSFTAICFSLSSNSQIRVKREDGPEQTLPLSAALTRTPSRKVSSFQGREISFEVSALF